MGTFGIRNKLSPRETMTAKNIDCQQISIGTRVFGYGSRQDNKMYKRNSIADKALLGQIKSQKQNQSILA